MATGLTLQIAARTDVGKVRKNNEDAFVVADLSGEASGTLSEPIDASLPVGERGVLLAVSDGMGGALAGEVASATGLTALVASLRDKVTRAAPERAMVQSVKDADRAVRETASRDAEHHGMGATLTAALIHGGDAYLAEVGDSRAYLVRAGVITQLTHDQSFVQMLVDRGALSAADAAQFPYKNVILQALGKEARIKVALSRLALRRRDCLLLCSDGLSNKVTDAEMRDAVLRESTLGAVCDELVALANANGGEDNVTILCAMVHGDAPEPHAREDLGSTLSVITSYEQ